MLEGHIKEILKEYKRTEKKDLLHLLPIYMGAVLVGYLRPITYDYDVAMPGLVHKLSEWRRGNPEAGTGTFDVTDARTEKWLKSLILDNELRILFLIMDLNGGYIGQIGLAAFNFEDDSADIDAVLRGEKNAVKGIMGAALTEIIAWGKRVLKFKNVYLDVFNDNNHAISFYLHHGFQQVERIALVQEHYENEVKWEIDSSLDPALAERCYIRMKYMNE